MSYLHKFSRTSTQPVSLARPGSKCFSDSNLPFSLNVSSRQHPSLSNKIKSTYEHFDSNQDRPVEWFFDQTKREQRAKSNIGFQGFSKVKCTCINTVA